MSKKTERRVPVAFISSTVEDLKPFREKARDAALAAGFYPRMMEYFPAADNPPLKECLDRITAPQDGPPADVLVVIVAHRYGWVPEGQPEGGRKSITWLECSEAARNGKEVLVFQLNDDADWSEELKEEFEITKALRRGKASPELLATVQDNLAQLSEFKKWLSKDRVRADFTTPGDLKSQVYAALQGWLQRHPEIEVDAAGDPSHYLRALSEETAYIDIRGLQVGSGQATRFPIEDLYITLKTASASDAGQPGKKSRQALAGRPEKLELEKALSDPRLVVIGDPGAGKTTFLRRICQMACKALLEDRPEATRPLGFEEPPFPILIRLSELQQHRDAQIGQSGAPAVAAAPEWLTHFLASQWKGDGGLEAKFFRKKLREGPALLLLDGLDEASSEKDRASLVKWIEKAAARWENCRMVVTSRPATYKGGSVLSGFTHGFIEALEDSAIETFLARWCQALFPGDAPRAEKHRIELLNALRLRPDIRRMARNPVMLTALAVVHWNEKRLPEQRADLYESILTWLARSREELPRRPSPERSLGLLQSLALAMQDHEEGRQVQVPRYWAAQAIAPEWRELPQPERIPAAQKFLDQEETDSGIVVRRGSEVRFWHLTFQEYLAARALAGLGDEEQHQRLLKSLYRSEWKEAVLLLAGVLLGQGAGKRVDNLVSAVLNQLGDEAPLPDQARCAGMLGAIVRDLSPLKYEPSDPRYQRLLKEVMGIFSKERPTGIPIQTAIEAAEALGQAGDPRLEGEQLEKNWVEIPAGKFQMGAQSEDKAGENFDSEAYEDEGPVHRVHLDAYRIGRYPVTVAEYRRFVEAGGYQEEGHWEEGGLGKWTEPAGWEDQTQHPNRPVVGVSWFEAAAYARWKGAQLPTEAQWERAARGSEGRIYPWGDKPEPEPGLLNYYESKIGVPSPVGVHPRGSTPEEIADLAGNVWEWCRDWYAEYPSRPGKNPAGPEKGSLRVLRGGAWLNDAWYCRCSYRAHYQPDHRHDLIGFRLVFGGLSARTKKRKP